MVVAEGGSPRIVWVWPVVGGLAAAALSPAAELATGSPIPYLLVLLILAAAVWALWRLTRREMGWRRGRPGDHLVALAYPVLVTGLLALLAWATGNVDPESLPAARLARRLGLMFLSTWIGALLTEEGFYRGALWGLCARSGWSRISTLLWTGLAFMAWHIAVPLIEEDFRLLSAQVPVYLGNVFLLGLAWGLLRLVSGSLLVACTAHAAWNALAYVLFGYGLQSAALGIDRISLFDPERGVLGLVLNAGVVAVMLLWSQRRGLELRRPA